MSVDPLLAPFLGTWRGSGTGTMPGMDPFGYEEEVRFLDVGSADLAYLQRAWDPASGEVLHAEAGMVRAIGDDKVVLTVAQPRRTEVSEGSARDGVMEVATTGTGWATGVKPVTTSRRAYRLEGDALTYEYRMAVGDMPRAERHLEGTLRRAEDVPQSIVK